MMCETLDKNKDFLEEEQEATSKEADVLDNFEVVIDEDTEPVDWDEAIASFLLSYIRKRQNEHSPIERKYLYEFSTN